MYSNVARIRKLFAKFRDKNVSVLWSGGFDSSFLVAMMIDAKPRNLELFTVDYANRPSVFQEKLARNNMLSRFQQLAGSMEVALSTNDVTGTCNAVGFRYSQMAWWAHLAPLATDASSEYVAIGYIAGEGIMLDKIHGMFKASNAMRASDDIGNKKAVFPLLEVEKGEIGYALLDSDIDQPLKDAFRAIRAFSHCCETFVPEMVPHIGSGCRCPSCNIHYRPGTKISGIGANAELALAIETEYRHGPSRVTWVEWLAMHPQWDEVVWYDNVVWGRKRDPGEMAWVAIANVPHCAKAMDNNADRYYSDAAICCPVSSANRPISQFGEMLKAAGLEKTTISVGDYISRAVADKFPYPAPVKEREEVRTVSPDEIVSEVVGA